MTQRDYHELFEMLDRHEGNRLEVYICTGGHLTIGRGRNIEANPLPLHIKTYLQDHGEITEEMSLELFEEDISRCIDEAFTSFDFFKELDFVRQDVVVDMLFNMGLTRLLGFKKMLIALDGHRYLRASTEMLDSRWAQQVGSRARELASMMASGKYLKKSSDPIPS